MSTKNPLRTKKFKSLVALLDNDEAAAIRAWNASNPENPISVPESEPAPLTSKEKSDTQVAQAGLVHVRGRVYVTPELLEASARVLKTGKPELIRVPGDRHTKGVALFRTDDGSSVALQNLGQPS